MKPITFSICLSLGLGLVTGLSPVPVLAFSGTGADDEGVTLEGEFVWARKDGDRTGALEAVFTPSTEADWSVAFHFTWEDEAHIYLGTANGDLEGGSLAGSAQSDDGDHKLSFRFSGVFDNGTFDGSHSFVKEDGSLVKGGTLTLAPKSPSPSD